jgi:two-component system, NarL family, nitrate/nitrite response regulator NarL
MAADEQEQIAVLVADRQPLFLAGVARTIRLDTGLRLVADMEDGARVLDAIRDLSPDVAIVDADLDATRILGAVAQRRLSTRVALVSADMTPDLAFGAMAAGACGCLSKRIRADMLCDAVRRIAAGGAVLCDEAQTVVASEIRLRYRNRHQLLTSRELDVLMLLAQGMSYPEVGRRLHLAPTTVKTYAGRVYERLGARDRLGAVVEAMRRGILD